MLPKKLELPQTSSRHGDQTGRRKVHVSEKHLWKGDIELISKILHVPLKGRQILKILLVNLQEESLPL